MAKVKDHGTSIKNDKVYEALIREGYSEQKAARIANTPNAGKKGGKAQTYEDRTKQELYDKAKEIGIDGRSKMNKKQLIYALRNN
ncbi:MAG: Rho termination factor N-terminal domain-containing protein [Gelidibacter sp.]